MEDYVIERFKEVHDPELSFDRCQFDHEFGRRQAGTVMNKAMDARHHRRSTTLELGIAGFRKEVIEFRRRRKVQLDRLTRGQLSD